MHGGYPFRISKIKLGHYRAGAAAVQRRGLSLIRWHQRIRFPDMRSKFPVLITWELREKLQRSCGVFGLERCPEATKSLEFPVNSHMIRVFDDREQFAADCVIHHSVSQFSHISENRPKSARVRAICDQSWTRRRSLAAVIRRIRQNLSGSEISRSIGAAICNARRKASRADVRSSFISPKPP